VPKLPVDLSPARSNRLLGLHVSFNIGSARYGKPEERMSSEAKDDGSTVVILLQQYKMAEERRSEFGRQFMQTTGFAIPLFATALGLAKADPVLLRIICGIGGPFFLGLAVLASRLGQRQDDCEATLSEIENALRRLGYAETVTLRPSKPRLSARKTIILFMASVGIILLIIAIVGIRGTVS
jgi:hypothetical protein